MPPACHTHLHVRTPFAHRRRELVCHAVLGLFGRGRVSDLAASQQHVSSVPLRALTARLAFARPAFGVPEVMAVLGSLQASSACIPSPALVCPHFATLPLHVRCRRIPRCSGFVISGAPFTTSTRLIWSCSDCPSV